MAVQKALNDTHGINVQLFSSLKKEGEVELYQYLDKVFELTHEN